MPANTLPSWANEPDGDMSGADDELMADIQRAMESRGYTDEPKVPLAPPAPTNDQQEDGISPPSASNTATNLDAPTVDGLDAGTPPSANAPADTPPAADAGGVVAPGDAGTLTPPAPGTEQTPPVAPTEVVYDITLPSGDTWQMNNEQANYLIQLHNWIDGKSPELKQQWQSIEAGTHVAIPAEDRTAYEAWLASGKPAAQAAPLTRPDIDPQFTDQAVIDYIAKLEAAAKPTTDTPPTPATPQLTEADVMARATAQANQRIQVQQALDQATAAVREKYGLTPEQVNHLSRVTPAMNIIPAIAEQHRTYSPLGELMSDAPMDRVFSEAFEVAMTRDPQLKAVYEEHIVNQHLASNNATLQAVGAKKANAASLASAPSAAVPSANIDPRKMTAQQRHDAMVAELAEEMAQR